MLVISVVVSVSLQVVYKKPSNSPPPREDTIVVISLIFLRFSLRTSEWGCSGFGVPWQQWGRGYISYFLLLWWCVVAGVLIFGKVGSGSCDLFVYWPEDPQLLVIWVISYWGSIWAWNSPPRRGGFVVGAAELVSAAGRKSSVPGGKSRGVQC